MSRALPLFHSISSFYLPFMSLRWLLHSVLQIGENFNMFLIYFQAWFIFVYIKHQPFAYIQPITFAYVNNNCSLIATISTTFLSLHLLFFRQQPVQFFFTRFCQLFHFATTCLSNSTTYSTFRFLQPFLNLVNKQLTQLIFFRNLSTTSHFFFYNFQAFSTNFLPYSPSGGAM